jgi:hypothetical protein
MEYVSGESTDPTESLTIANSPTFADGNYVILVNGDLSIKGNINVDATTNSTVLFSVRGDINIDPSVTNIQGFYSADKDFNTGTSASCPLTPDDPLTIVGGIVTNAGKTSPAGQFRNQRDLCLGNACTPSTIFTQRLDLILNAPDFIKTPSSAVWREVAPDY